MKRIILRALCTATVEEAWTFDAPDELDLPADPEEVFDLLMGEEESPEGVVLVGIENYDVDDERDREIRAYSVGEVPDEEPTPALLDVVRTARDDLSDAIPMVLDRQGDYLWELERVLGTLNDLLGD